MIRGYVGLLGSGKTLSMVRAAVEAVRAGRQVYTNMQGLHLPEAMYVPDVSAIVGVGSGLLLLDEAGVCLSSRYWQQVPQTVLMALAQSRHNGLDLYWTAPSESRVDTVLREITCELVRCRRVGSVCVQVTSDPSTKVVLRRRLARVCAPWIAMYDTSEIIHVDGSGGGYGQAAEAIAARRRRSRSGAVRRGASLRLDWSEYWRRPVRRWYDCRGRMTRDAVVARDWLVAQGYLRPDRMAQAGWTDIVARELARRAWLRVCGLTGEDVPYECRYSSPWALGYDPVSVVERMAESDVVPRDRARSRRASRAVPSATSQVAADLVGAVG